jgi:hypothetical protein
LLTPEREQRANGQRFPLFSQMTVWELLGVLRHLLQHLCWLASRGAGAREIQECAFTREL